jgi:hypothetical protein
MTEIEVPLGAKHISSVLSLASKPSYRVDPPERMIFLHSSLLDSRVLEEMIDQDKS